MADNMKIYPNLDLVVFGFCGKYLFLMVEP